MFRIGLLSDTHGYFDEGLVKFFEQVDEIWHAGDIGDINVINRLETIRPVIAVFGNIDDATIRNKYPLHQRVYREGLDIWMTHIGGYPGKYAREIISELNINPPGLFISGHSHILKVMHDKKRSLLHINPGAAGRAGLHKERTAIRFNIESGRVTDLEIIELGNRSAV